MSLNGPQIDLCNALKGQDEALALSLIHAIADVNFFDADRNMPLHLACVKPWPKVVQTLLDKGALNVKAWSGKTVLHLAQENALLDIAEILIRHEPKLRTMGDKYGRTPLHQSAAENKVDFLKLYLTLKVNQVAVKCAVDVQDYRKSTALHDAVKMGHVEAVTLLLAHDANPELCDDGACKARAYAEFPRNEAILALLAPKAPSLFSLAAIKVIEEYEPPQEGLLDEIFTQASKVVTIHRENQRQQDEAEAQLLRDRQAAKKMIEDAPKLKALEEGFARLGLGSNTH